ncbi:MAG TPA: CopD family protein, partial [Solirubrobacteraceae bacterium]|nr:CopD family protein [Solirubrobacteraceae bacterium]
PARLPDGTYTATYRVISADTHIVYGGLVFNVARASRSAQSVAGLINRNRSGPVTNVAFGAVRALDYLAIALVAGTLVFLLWVVGDGRLGGAFERRAWQLIAAGALLGVTVSVLGILLQGAEASGLSLWSSVRSGVIWGILSGRFGWVWGIKALVFAAALAGLPLRRRRTYRQVLAAGCAYLILTPALAGHASVQSPVWAFLPANMLHVLAASVWVGGIAAIVFALPLATRPLAAPARTQLLVEVLGRFSRLALAAVAALALTGVIEAYIDVRSLHALTHSTYGELVALKTGLLGLLIGLGAVNRERVLPTLRRLLAAASAPGATGVLLRDITRGELAAMVAVFGTTAALVSFAPPIDAAAGPFQQNVRLGPAELEAVIAPDRAGVFQMHLYLIDARSGAPYLATKQLTVTAALPGKRIGPLDEPAYATGPGHYTVPDATLSPPGNWSVTVSDRISLFQEYSVTLHVPVS